MVYIHHAPFRANGLFDEAARFDIAASNLTEAAINLTIDLLKNRPVSRPYGVLKERLSEEHQPTSFHCARALRSAPDTEDRTPIQLLVALFKLCPEGEEDTCNYIYM